MVLEFGFGGGKRESMVCKQRAKFGRAGWRARQLTLDEERDDPRDALLALFVFVERNRYTLAGLAPQLVREEWVRDRVIRSESLVQSVAESFERLDLVMLRLVRRGEGPIVRSEESDGVLAEGFYCGFAAVDQAGESVERELGGIRRALVPRPVERTLLRYSSQLTFHPPWKRTHLRVGIAMEGGVQDLGDSVLGEVDDSVVGLDEGVLDASDERFGDAFLDRDQVVGGEGGEIVGVDDELLG